ncbi:MAG: isoprenyl transferase [Eubacteriales bacterium]|nr:isoprenyl transferase [Eubacteriales bacterium]MDD3881340.1 isoprenyl transferase [Eubacteriales bacterium]MDD4513667.1 isoprenyl transferase [Eubacteriales bacterium]
MKLFAKKTDETQIPQEKLPKHVAIIMDGNGRWAKKHKAQAAFGHRAGMEPVHTVIRMSNDLHINTLSLYAFSTENWTRSPEEVDALMGLLCEFFFKDIDELIEKNVHIRVLGDKDGLPKRSRDVLYDAEKRTESCTGMNLCLAINYGSRQEIVRAAALYARDCVEKGLKPAELTEKAFSDYLYTAGLPDVDLMIRTSGEMRLSNFLLFQNAYAEFDFPVKLWPDFSGEDYMEALKAYASRDRRFGGRKKSGS